MVKLETKFRAVAVSKEATDKEIKQLVREKETVLANLENCRHSGVARTNVELRSFPKSPSTKLLSMAFWSILQKARLQADKDAQFESDLHLQLSQLLRENIDLKTFEMSTRAVWAAQEAGLPGGATDSAKVNRAASGNIESYGGSFCRSRPKVSCSQWLSTPRTDLTRCESLCHWDSHPLTPATVKMAPLARCEKEEIKGAIQQGVLLTS